MLTRWRLRRLLPRDASARAATLDLGAAAGSASAVAEADPAAAAGLFSEILGGHARGVSSFFLMPPPRGLACAAVAAGLGADEVTAG